MLRQLKTSKCKLLTRCFHLANLYFRDWIALLNLTGCCNTVLYRVKMCVRIKRVSKIIHTKKSAYAKNSFLNPDITNNKLEEVQQTQQKGEDVEYATCFILIFIKILGWTKLDSTICRLQITQVSDLPTLTSSITTVNGGEK